MTVCGVVEEVRTYPPETRAVVWRFIKDTGEALDDPEGAHIAGNLKRLRGIIDRLPQERRQPARGERSTGRS